MALSEDHRIPSRQEKLEAVVDLKAPADRDELRLAEMGTHTNLDYVVMHST